MKKVVLSVVALAALASPTLAADLVSKGPRVAAAAPAIVTPWDIAFGGAIMSDYNFRGISQSDRGPTASAYVEPRYNVSPNLQLYVGLAGTGVNLPQSPSAEIDLYGGIRPTFGPLAFDFGAIYYAYPSGNLVLYPNGNISLADQSYWEIYAKGTYSFNDVFSVGANLYVFDSWLNTGASGYYASGTAKYVLPPMGDLGWYVSGEYGLMRIGTSDVKRPVYFVPVQFPDYSTWNVGLAFTYKAFTLDLRYYDSDLTKGECNVLTGDPSATFSAADRTPFNNFNLSKWCNAAYIAKLSFDTTLLALK